MVGRFIGSIRDPLERLGMFLQDRSMSFSFAGLLSAVFFFCSLRLIRHFLLIVGIVPHAKR